MWIQEYITQLNECFFISGFGWAMVFSPSISTLSKYFDKRRSLALGIAFSGVGMSSFAFSPLLQMLVETYTWRGALMILAGLELNLCVCGALLRPIRLREDYMFQTENTAKHRSLTTLKKLHALLDLDLLKHHGFMVFTLSFTFINTGFFIPYVHLLAHLQMLGFSSLSGAFVISAVAVADIVARLFSGWLADLRRIRMVHLFFFWTLTTGIIIVMIPFGQTYMDMIIIGIVYGFASGAMAPIGISLLSKIVGIARITSAIGFLMLLESVGSLLGPPISGAFSPSPSRHPGHMSHAQHLKQIQHSLIHSTRLTRSLSRVWSVTLSLLLTVHKKKTFNSLIPSPILRTRFLP